LEIFIDRPDGGREKDMAVAVAKARIDDREELLIHHISIFR
jgi:hypothetical protein